MKREPTEFESRVYALISTIPMGSVSTYGRVAHALGCASAQAVGQALRRNPYAPEVPCHRVVAGDRSIGGFSGKRRGSTIDKKLRLLSEEGVAFDSDERVSERAVYDFPEDR